MFLIIAWHGAITGDIVLSSKHACGPQVNN